MTEDIISLTELRARLTRQVARLGRGADCLVVTRNGRPAAIMLSPREYDRLRYGSFVRAKLAAGLADAAARATRSHDEVMAAVRAAAAHAREDD
jgi:prevent-host-death family protein